MRPTQEQIAETLKKRKAIADELRYWVEIYNKGGISFTDLLQARIAELDPTPPDRPDDEWEDVEIVWDEYRPWTAGKPTIRQRIVGKLRKVKP